MPSDKRKTVAKQVENLKLALEIFSSSPLGQNAHPKLGKANTPGTFRIMLLEVMGLAPRGTFVRMSSLEERLLWFYRAGRRFPDKIRLVALFKAAHLVFTANDEGTLEALKDFPEAKKLRGKKPALRDIDLGHKKRIAGSSLDPASAEKPVNSPVDAQHEQVSIVSPKSLPPNIIGAHFIALRGAADAFREMVNFGQVALKPEDRNQLAMIAISLMRLGNLDAETFQVALHGQPITGNDKDVVALVKAFTGNKRKR